MSHQRSTLSRRYAAWGVLVTLVWALPGCGRRPAREAAAKAKAEETVLPPVAKEEVETFALANYTDDGHKRWEVGGKTANLMAELIHLTDVTAIAYGEETNVTLTAREGTFDRQERNIQLTHDVRAVTTEGTVLTTETLAWNAERQVASSPDWTTVERENMVVQGQGAEGSPQLKQVRFQRDVQVDLKPATKITCRGPLQVDYPRRRARFWRDVHVQDPRGQIWADRMDVRIDPKTQKLSEVQCWGHVRIQQGQQLARAHRAVYRQQAGTIVLIGHPRVTFYADEAQREP